MSVTLILGGARSGKSHRAEGLAADFAGPVTVLATAQPLPHDDEWCARIEAHRNRRPSTWRTCDVPLELACALAAESQPDRLLLVDCMTVWLSNWLLEGRSVDSGIEGVVEGARECPARLILVSNEVGSGVVPATALGREFRDAHGLMNQRLAAVAGRVELLVAGLPLVLKGDATE